MIKIYNKKAFLVQIVISFKLETQRLYKNFLRLLNLEKRVDDNL